MKHFYFRTFVLSLLLIASANIWGENVTFSKGSTIYVDFTALTSGGKGVNYPNASKAEIDYDANGAGTVKTITFTNDVTWSTGHTFIKCECGGWAALAFTNPNGKNCAKVAADGKSYSWTDKNVEKCRLYYSNPDNWSEVYAYLWVTTNGSTTKNAEWPGKKTTAEIIQGKTFYYIEFDSSKGYNNIIFNNNGNGSQTDDLSFSSADCGQYFDGQKWLDLPQVIESYTLTLHANGGLANGSATIAYGATEATDLKRPTRTGYTLLGYYAEEECTKLVMNTDGTLVDADGYVANGQWCRKENTTLYAKWQEIAQSGITLYILSEKGGVMLGGDLYKEGSKLQYVGGQSVDNRADCEYANWWYINFPEADAMQQLYIYNNDGCSRNTSPFTLSGEGDYYFDCSGSNTIQVASDRFCVAPEVTLYVWSADWNGYTPKIKYRLSKTTGTGYGSVSEKEMVSMLADGCDSRWYKCVFNEDNLKTVQVELWLCKGTSCKAHKINNNWYSVNAGTSVWWDISDGCADNEKAPVVTRERPCRDVLTYSVTYDANGGSAAPPVMQPQPQRAVFPVAAYSGTRDGYEFGGWNDGNAVWQPGDSYTMPAQEVRFTAVWNKKTTSGWALVGAKFGSWDKEKGVPFDMRYRGQENIFYCVTKLSNMSDWFKISDRTHLYSCTSEAVDITQPLSYFSKAAAPALYQNNHNPGGAMKISDANADKNVWVVLDRENKKFWVEDVAVLYDVTVTHTIGDAVGSTCSLKNVYGVEAHQFASAEDYELTVSPADGYYPVVTLDGKEVTLTWKNTVSSDTRTNTAVYTYIGRISNANQNIVVRYEKLAPMHIFVHLDKGLMTNDGWDWSNAAPLIQWNATNTAEGWSGFSDNHRLSRLVGFEDWFEFTFDGQTVLTWQLRDAASADNGHYSGQQQITAYDESFCYSIDDYKMTAYDNQMRISRFDCPEANVRLNVNGGTMVGSTAELSSEHNISTGWAGGEVVTTYSYRYNNGNWHNVPDNNEVLVMGAGTYTYKATVSLSKDGKVLYENYATRTIVVEEPHIILETSTTAATAKQQITATVTLDNVANTRSSYIVMSLWKGKDKQEVEFTETNENEFTFSMPDADGTYTLRAEFLIGETEQSALLITYAEKNIRIGSLTAVLTISPVAPKIGDPITLTVTPDNAVGIVSYTYTVKTLANPTVRVLASNIGSNTYSFTPSAEDSYTFVVVVCDNDKHEVTLTQTVAVSGKDMYIHYPFTGPSDWPTYKMTYKGEGIYVYYSAEKGKESKFYGEKVGGNPLHAAYIGTSNTTSASDKQQYIGIVSGNPNKGDIVTFVFDNNSKHLYIYADKAMHRLKSVTDYGTFYSNVRGDAGPVSFFATSTGKQYLQTFTDGDWQDTEEPSSLVAADGIFTATMNADGSIVDVQPYTDTLTVYYLSGKVRDYSGDKGRMVDFSNVSSTYYDHYHLEWTGGTSKELGATVGNSINKNIANILAEYTVPVDCNARYEYNSITNKLSRTTIAAAAADTKFLTIYGDGLIKSDGTAYTKTNPLTLEDGADWVYRAELEITKAEGLNSGVRGYLMATFNGEQCWILAATGLETASDASLPIVGSATAAGTYNIILMYDYKTNRITAGWKPSETVKVDGELVVDANILFVRQENSDVAQLVLNTDDSKVSGLQKVVFVMQLAKDSGTTGESHYKFSLPFDCYIKDIYGLSGNYLKSWGIQRYNGEERARTGWFEGNRATFWEWMDYNGMLRAGEGYSLSVARGALGTWHGDKYLYFPSAEDGFEMTKTGLDTKVEYPNQPCNVNLQYPDDPDDNAHRDRRKYDSNWKLIGPKNYNNIKIRISDIEWDDNYYLNRDVPSYVYELNKEQTEYIPNSTEDFQFRSFFSYFVQFAGTIVWEQYTQSQHTALSAPRRAPSAVRMPADFRIELRDLGDNELDRTFVALSAQGTEGFDLNLDLTKISAAHPQIYTISEHTAYAGNTLPLSADTVALEITAPAGGFYTIALPHDNRNYDVLLVDRFEQQAVVLSDDGCRVKVNSGKTSDRFSLVFSPKVQPSQPEGPATGMPCANAATSAHKVLINGVIYIVRGNRLYDLNGKMVTL